MKYGFRRTGFHETRSKSTDFTFSFSIEFYWNRRKNGEIQVNILFTPLNKEHFLIAPIFLNLASTPQSLVVVSYIEPYPAQPIIIIIIIGIQPLGRSGQRPEYIQATGMALVRCILGKFLGVACHCFPPLFRCSHFSPTGASTSATTWEITATEVGTVGENVVR